MEAFASIIIGVAVEHDYFWERSEDFIGCPKGHERESDRHKNCPECGSKYVPVHKRSPSDAFVAWADKHRPGIPYNEIVPPKLNAEGIEACRKALEPFSWLPGSYYDSETEPEFWVIGRGMCGTAIIESNPGSLALDERTISETMAEVAEFVGAMGIDTEPSLYLVTRCSF